MEEKIEKTFKAIKWYGHASFGIETEKIIYFDPWKMPDTSPKADVILVTHSHFDHLSVRDIDYLSKKGTTIVCTEDCEGQLKGDVRAIRPGEEIDIQGIKIKAVPAYNPNKTFHPRNKGWVGYIIDVNGISIYHAGDTDYVSEMKEAGKINIALFPVGGTYTMNAEEAARAANTIKPDISIPMHYGSEVIGTEKDALKFSSLCDGEVRILKKTKL
ncbi:MAG: MBL fold metallo-hydrolase [Candidatus Aminicenantales bacterium]